MDWHLILNYSPFGTGACFNVLNIQVTFLVWNLSEKRKCIVSLYIFLLFILIRSGIIRRQVDVIFFYDIFTVRSRVPVLCSYMTCRDFSPCTSEPQKQAPWHQAQRLLINIPSFHFFLCYLIKKRQSHNFDCPTADILEMISLLMGLWQPRALPPPASLLDPRGGSGSFLRECSWETYWAVTGLSIDQNAGNLGEYLWLFLAPVVSPPRSASFTVPPCRSYQWEWLADIPGEMQATHVSIAAGQPGC